MSDEQSDVEIITEEEVANMLRIKPSTVADFARRGDLPSIKLGKHRRYVKSDVAAYVNRRRTIPGCG